MLAPVVADHSMILPRDEDITEFLRSTDFDVRLQTLNRLAVLVKRDPHWFTKFVKKGDLFKQFERLLMDDRWEVQHQCIKLLHDALPTFGNYVEWCVSYLLPCIVTKLGSPKITIRRITNQMLIAYLKLQPGALNTVQKVLTSFLLNDEYEIRTKFEALGEIPNLMIAECTNQNWRLLIDGLTKMLINISFERREQVVGVLAEFNAYLGTEKLREILSELSDEQQEMCKIYEEIIFEKHETLKENPSNTEKISSMPIDLELRYRFGIIPAITSNMLTNDTDPPSRIIALEQVRKILDEITPEDARKFATHLHSYFLTLGNVLDDLNFKVVVLGLDVLRLTVQKVGHLMAPYTKQVIGLISKHFGNQKLAIKQQIMAICMISMKNCSPKSVISYLCVYSEYKSSRTREEILNIMTAALLTFDSHSINLQAVADVVLPLLVDPKRRVRLAAFELFAVLVHSSNGSIESLLKLVMDMEQKMRAYGLLNAVKVRISRKILPRIRSDGLIEYAIPLGVDISLNQAWPSLRNETLDYDWIMSGNSGSSSAFSRKKWPSIASVLKMSSSSSSTSIPALKNGSTTEGQFWNQEEWNRSQIGSQIGIISMGKAKVLMGVRPRSDDSDRFIKNENGLHGRRKDQDLFSQSLDRIRLEKLQLNNNLVHNNTNMIRKNDCCIINGTEKKESIVEKSSLNGYNELKRRTSDANITANCDAIQEMKIVDPDEIPIRPSQFGDNYGYAPSEPVTPTRYIVPLNRKSLSHQNLASTSKMNNTSQHSRKTYQKNQKNGSSVKLKHVPSIRSLKSNASTISLTKHARNVPSTDVMLKNPEVTLKDALRQLDDEDWNEKLSAIEIIATLSEFSPMIVSENIHDVLLSLRNECKNLRSTVSRAAIAALGTLFKNLKTVMDLDIEKVCLVLMQKAGDVSSAFIRDDATLALEEMIRYTSPARAFNALITAGVKSKSSTIRSCCASSMIKLIERVGPINAVTNFDFSRLINVLLIFSRDSSAAVRYSGKYGIKLLSQNGVLFDDAVRKNLTESDRQNLRDVLNIINRRGLESSNLDASSMGSSVSRNGSIRRLGSNGRGIRQIPQGVQQDLLNIRNDLNASEWERRMKGLKEFSEMITKDSRAALSDTKVVAAFVNRISDINSKVSLKAMEILIIVIPTLSVNFSKETSLKAVLSQLVNSLVSHLASRNEEHRQHAKLCIEETTKYIENAALLTSFAAATKHANVKQKPFMLHILNKLNESVYPSKPRQVEVTGLPVLWELLRTPARSRSDPEVREAVRSYVTGLVQCFGAKTLLELSTPQLTPSQKYMLRELIV